MKLLIEMHWICIQIYLNVRWFGLLNPISMQIDFVSDWFQLVIFGNEVKLCNEHSSDRDRAREWNRSNKNQKNWNDPLWSSQFIGIRHLLFVTINKYIIFYGKNVAGYCLVAMLMSTLNRLGAFYLLFIILSYYLFGYCHQYVCIRWV